MGGGGLGLAGLGWASGTMACGGWEEKEGGVGRSRVGCDGGVGWEGEGGARAAVGRRTERPRDLRQSRRERCGVEVAHCGTGHELVAGAVERGQLGEVEHRHLVGAEIRGEVRRCGYCMCGEQQQDGPHSLVGRGVEEGVRRRDAGASRAARADEARRTRAGLGV